MNILVTGGAGFIGSHIVNGYIDEGHSVTVIDNLSSGEKRFLNPSANFYEMDILDPKVSDVLKKEKINAINHHAAQISVSDSVANPLFDANSNIIGTLQLIQSAVSSNIEKFVFASTGGAMYGEQVNFPASEEHPCQPLSPYGISKLCAENYLRFFNEQYGMSTTILRYSNVFGPHQNPHGEAGVVAIFCQKLVKDEKPVICGDGKQTRDFISVRDVVQANLIALDPACTGTYNVGTGEETSVNTMTECLIGISGKKISAIHDSPRRGEQRRSVIDYKKFHNSFGWKPKVSLEQGLIETYDFFKQ
ncbi:MAG: NAD-dependent epimerase/dehydratase family protein [Nitrospina sp.]|jgi:UDP-glucose 4-epimerase|nr:NAD-dependent epimerase/dehydratase family protein [Nitrospina sp.]MBT5633361.1 NAD-dependent epimerase/dehydratase family protein [Nitrospina sp.]